MNVISTNPLRLLVHCSFLACDGVVAEVPIDPVPLHLEDQICVASKVMNPPVWYDCVSLWVLKVRSVICVLCFSRNFS